MALYHGATSGTVWLICRQERGSCCCMTRHPRYTGLDSPSSAEDHASFLGECFPRWKVALYHGATSGGSLADLPPRTGKFLLHCRGRFPVLGRSVCVLRGRSSSSADRCLFYGERPRLRQIGVCFTGKVPVLGRSVSVLRGRSPSSADRCVFYGENPRPR